MLLDIVFLCLRGHEELGLHVDFAELRDTPAQLKKRLHTIEDTHVSKSNLPNKFQLGVLRESGDSLRDSEHGADNIVRGVTKSPVKMLEKDTPLTNTKKITHQSSLRPSRAASTLPSQQALIIA
jgi:hypothetical protein